MTSHFSRKRTAFTLAEVLITLGIIGVVAALTMPVLMANYQKKQTVTQLKKAYSELSQALKLAEAEHGTIDSWDFSDFETPADRIDYFSKNYLFPNINILKKANPASTDCWSEEVYNIDGTPITNFSLTEGRACFSTPSGYSVYYWIHGTGNGGWFVVDINGSKKPNILGKDIFPLLFGCGNSEKVLPSQGEMTVKLGLSSYGAHGKNIQLTRDELKNGSEALGLQGANCKKSSGIANAGYLCGALIQADGWEISSDYPW